MSLDQHEEGRFRSSPTGPRVAPPRQPMARPAAPLPRRAGRRRPYWSVIIFILLMSGAGIRAYKDLSRPDAWAYWKDQYYAPSLTSRLIAKSDLDGSGHGRAALAISGTIGPAAASWFRDRLDEAHLAAGDAVLLSSPGGNLDQAVIIGCVLAYAGGKTRYGVEGSMLGVHRFVTTAPVPDPVADTQRIAGLVLGYMTKMGVSSTVVEAMSQTRDVRWLSTREALAMNLVTDPIGRP